jgi:hypothetical protein
MRLWQAGWLLLGIILVVVLPISPINKKTVHSNAVVDISWPNCQSFPRTGYTQGIVGVTGGLDFRPNKCLNAEAAMFSVYQLYMNTGYPGAGYGRKFQHAPLTCGPTSYVCLGYNYGYNAAMYALNYASRQDAHATTWWLDVETDNSWTTNPNVNIAVLRGAVAAIKQHIFPVTVGYYSYPGQWELLTNNWHNGLPAWVATGQTAKTAAVLACHGTSFTGGPISLAQYTVILDENVACQSQ